MINIPIIFGKPIYIWLGIVLAVQIIFQILSGMNVLKINFKYHRWNGRLIALNAFVHALFALGIWFFGFTLGEPFTTQSAVETNLVTIQNSRFEPSVVKIKAGEKVPEG